MSRTFLIVAGIVLVSRLPFLGAGYGWDSDAWRVAAVAHSIAGTGQYAASRFPGNPIHELLCALLLRGGPWALNGLSALASAIGAGCFALLLRRLGVRPALLGAFALAATPAFYVASVTTLDYALALALLIAALERAYAGKAVVAGLLLGLAIGCRLTTAAMILPLALLVARDGSHRTRNALTFATASLAIGALAFLPAVAAAGWKFFSYYDHGYPAPLLVLKKATLDFWGTLGATVLAIVLFLRVVFRGTPRALPGHFNALAWGLGCGIGVLTFLSLPYKPAYLLPALPFALVLLARFLTPRTFAISCLAILASPWVLLVHPQRDDHTRIPSPGSFTVGSLRVEPARGLLEWDHARRLADMEYVRGVMARTRALDRPSVIVAHDWQPQIRVRVGGDHLGEARFVYLVSPGEMAELRTEGARIYYLEGADQANVRERAVDLARAGARPL